MNVIFEHKALIHLPRFERELKLSHIDRQVSELAEYVGQCITVACSTNTARTYNITVKSIDNLQDMCYVEVNSIVE